MIKKHLKKSTIIWLSLFAGSLILNILFLFFGGFADFFNSEISCFFRLILAKITNVLPFSLGEILIYLALPAAVIIAIIAIRKNTEIKDKIFYVLKAVFGILTVIYLLFVLSFAPGYNAAGLDEKLGFDRQAVSANELYETLVYVIEKTNECASEITFEDDGASVSPHTLDGLSDKLCVTYGEIYSEYGLKGTFSSRVKPLIISPYMTYTHISGVYSFFTGEANLNTNYPDFVNVFSASHELAHQRGVAREDEANFMAYLVCISNEDAYIRYSGYLNMYSYLADALYSADRELYRDAVSMLSEDVKNELIAYSKFFDKYRDSTAATVSDTVNDAYLKSQGTKGSVSYGMVVDLAVAYHKNCR